MKSKTLYIILNCRGGVMQYLILSTSFGPNLMQAISQLKYVKIFGKDTLNWGTANLAFIVIMLLIVNSTM